MSSRGWDSAGCAIRLDLSGSVIVLAHPRTGSSLVMQTLGLLGADVLGDVERPDLPAEANPKGFFEHRAILRHGLQAPDVAARPDLLAGRAFKLPLRKLVDRGSADEWAALARPGARLLLSIRAPAESLLSRAVFSPTGLGVADNAQHFHRWASRQVTDLGVLAQWVCSLDTRGSEPVCIDYRQATDHPAGYVGRIARAAGLRPSPAQVAEAIANIDVRLYRYRADARADVREVAKRVRPLEKAYDMLRSDDPRRWPRLRDYLSSWVPENRGA